MPSTLQIEFAGETLILLADRAIHWPREKTLVLADVHLGKDASFRAAGLPVPNGNSPKDLKRIETLLEMTGAKKLIVLGDLVHSKTSHQPELAQAFTSWRKTHAELEVILIRGNHDRHAGPPPLNWNIQQVSEGFEVGPFTLNHIPKTSDRPTLCGHIHPAVSVRDFDGSYVTACCFVADTNQLILPAFGSFTGGYKMQSEPGRTIYPVMGKTVVRLPATT